MCVWIKKGAIDQTPGLDHVPKMTLRVDWDLPGNLSPDRSRFPNWIQVLEYLNTNVHSQVVITCAAESIRREGTQGVGHDWRCRSSC
jgi:hypothetical protein